MASRSKRLQPIQQHTDSLARDAAADLSHAQRELTRQRDSLNQLIAYRDEYGRDFSLHGEAVRDANWLRNYRVFLTQLNQGIEQQRVVVSRCEQQLTEARRAWERKQHHAKALDKAVDRLRANERRHEDKREQRAIEDLGVKHYDR